MDPDTYAIRRLIVGGLSQSRLVHHPRCPYCNGGQAIHSDGVTCGCPPCKRKHREKEVSDVK